MPAQKRPIPPECPDTFPEDKDCKDNSPPSVRPHQEQQVVEQHSPTPPLLGLQQQEQFVAEQDVNKPDLDRDNEDGGNSPLSDTIQDEFLIVKLTDIRKEVQCPICLGIIRKTRTVMECLHRFCRECIDKAMRLGKNECPACRTHCASRRSLRDDPNYDALIAVLYPDIDKYEEEELAFHDKESSQNKKIQEFIAKTLRKQTEAPGRRRSTRAPSVGFMRRSPGGFRRGQSKNFMRGVGFQGSDDENEDANGNDVGKDYSSADECVETRPKRSRRWSIPRTSPALAEGAFDEHDDIGNGEAQSASPGHVGSKGVFVWGKGGVRSQTRHGGGGGSNGKNVKGNRISKLLDYLKNLDENDSEFDVHLTLLPLDKETIPSLEHPHLCCQPTLSVGHIRKFIALQTSTHAGDIEILAKKPQNRDLVVNASISDGDPASLCGPNPLKDDFQTLGAQESIADLHACFSSGQSDLVLIYRKIINNP